MAFADEIAKAGVRVVPLLELSLDGGTERFSITHARGGGGFYEGRATVIGSVERALCTPWGGMQTATAQVVLSNTDKALSNWDRNKLLNREAAILLSANGQTATIFSGVIRAFSYSLTSVSLTIADLGDKYFGDLARWWLSRTLTAADWPGLDPEWDGKPAPVVLGEHDSVEAGHTGMLECVRLSATKYMAAGHAMQAVFRVFDGDTELTRGYTVTLAETWAKGIGGYACIIDFTDPPGSNVAVDGRGLTDDLSPTGVLVTNPVSQLQILCEQVFGLPAGSTDTTAFATAAAYCAARKQRSAGRVADMVAAREYISQILASHWLFGGFTAAGKFAVWAISPPLPNAGGTRTNFALDMLDGWSTGPSQAALANQWTIQYRKNWASGNFAGQIQRDNAASQSLLGGIYQHELDLPWAADWLTAQGVMDSALLMSAYLHQCSWDEPLQHAEAYDLAGQVAMTHPWGPTDGTAGWDGQELLLIKIVLDPLNMTLSLESLDVHHLTEAVLGAGFSAGGVVPAVVI